MSSINMEEFPALINLPKQTRNERSPSALSSVSTTSIGALDAVKARIARGSYYTLDRIAVRPRLKCLCEQCGAEVPKEDKWNSKCNRAIYVANTGIDCEVTDSKVIRHGNEKFSVAYIETEYFKGATKVCGWVLSKCLNRYFCTDGSQSVTRPPTVHVDRSRSRSASVFTAESPFCFGDLVLVRFDAATENWVRGEVRQENPLLILVEGTSRPQRFHAQNLKMFPTREFVTTVNTSVRSQKPTNTASFHTLKAGTKVRVAYMEGFEGRITAPVNGWISMRTDHFLNVIEPSWVYTPQNPTIVISNLPPTITEKKLKRALAFNVLKITFQSRGDEYRAIVSLRSNRKAVSRLVARKQLLLPKNTVAEVCWDVRYLKNLAAYQLQRRK